MQARCGFTDFIGTFHGSVAPPLVLYAHAVTFPWFLCWMCFCFKCGTPFSTVMLCWLTPRATKADDSQIVRPSSPRASKTSLGPAERFWQDEPAWLPKLVCPSRGSAIWHIWPLLRRMSRKSCGLLAQYLVGPVGPHLDTSNGNNQGKQAPAVPPYIGNPC